MDRPLTVSSATSALPDLRISSATARVSCAPCRAPDAGPDPAIGGTRVASPPSASSTPAALTAVHFSLLVSFSNSRLVGILPPGTRLEDYRKQPKLDQGNSRIFLPSLAG